MTTMPPPIIPPSTMSSSMGRFDRSEIMRLAAADASLGIRYVPPQPYLQMPLLPYFMPQLYTPITSQTTEDSPVHQPATKSSKSSRLPVRSRSGSVSSLTSFATASEKAPSAAPSTAVSSSVRPAWGSKKPAAANAATSSQLSSSVRARKKPSATGAKSANSSKVTTPVLQSQPASSQPNVPQFSVMDTIPVESARPTVPQPQPQPIPSSSSTVVPTTPRTPRTPRSVPSSPRASLSRPTTPRRRSWRDAKTVAPAPVAPILNETEIKQLVQTLLQEELKRVAQVDRDAKEHVLDMNATRAVRNDFIRREEEERRRILEEQTQRPNYYIFQAQEGIKGLKKELLPLLQQADQALERLYEKKNVVGRSTSLLSQLSATSAQIIANNADQLADQILDHVLLDTIDNLNLIEEQKQLDHVQRTSHNFLGTAWELVEAYEQDREAIARKYQRLNQEGVLRQRLPEVQVSPPRYPVPPASSHDEEKTLEPSEYKSSRLDPYVPSQPSYSSHVKHSSLPTQPSASSSTSTSARPSLASTIANSSSTLPPPSTDHYYKPRPTPSHEVPLKPANFVRLPLVPNLVSSCEQQRDAFADYQRQKASQSFLTPYQLQLDTIVQAASDDILDELITQACEEVGQICDGYVERVFEAEFQVDLDQMVEEDVEQQMREQQQHQYEQQEQTDQYSQQPHPHTHEQSYDDTYPSAQPSMQEDDQSHYQSNYDATDPNDSGHGYEQQSYEQEADQEQSYEKEREYTTDQ